MQLNPYLTLILCIYKLKLIENIELLEKSSLN